MTVFRSTATENRKPQGFFEFFLTFSRGEEKEHRSELSKVITTKNFLIYSQFLKSIRLDELNTAFSRFLIVVSPWIT